MKYLLVVFCLISQMLYSQSLDKTKLDNYFSVLDQNHKVMGSFAIAKDGKIIYKKVIGFSDVETNKKADVNTVYRIGSISKTFTAVLVMKAIEKGKLKLERPLSTYFPQIKNAEKINIESLLRHQSGIHNFTDDAKEYYSYNTQPISQFKLLDIIVKGGSDFEPNTKYSYSNSNYVLLAMILEKINKKPYAEQISEQIVKPLGLKFTTVGKKINPQDNVANSYLFVENKYEKSHETDMSVPLGAGNIVSTPSELLVFINALAEGKLVSKESLEKMKIYKDHYGLGIFEVPFDGKRGFGHNGRIDEFQSVLYYFPDGKTSFAMITNQSNYDNNQISITALSAAYGLDFKIPSFNKVELKAEELKQFEGTYASLQFPLKIKVFVENGKLMAQATGQGAFPLEAISTNEFTFEPAGITLKFNKEKQEMFYTQMGQAINFTKEK